MALDILSSALGGAGSLIGGLLGGGNDDAERMIEENRRLYGGLSVPSFDQYNPELEAAVGEGYNPELAKATTIQEDPGTRQKQLDVLSQLSGLSQTGLSAQDASQYSQAQQSAAQMARGSRAALETGAAARGMGGGGLDFSLQEQANQDAATRAMNSGLQIAGNAAQQRANYTTAYGNDLSSLRGQDLNANSANANILNQFNQANTNAVNSAANQAWQNRQAIANQNVAAKNNAQQVNNGYKQTTYSDQLQKANGQAGANTAVAGVDAQKAAASQGLGQGVGLAAGVVGGQLLGGGTKASSPTPMAGENLQKYNNVA